MTYRKVEDLKVGDTVHYVGVNFKDRIVPVIVTKIGSKLITTEKVEDFNYTVVFRKDTLRSNDAYGHDTLIVDLQQYLDNAHSTKMMYKIVDELKYRLKDHSIDKITQIFDLLGLTLKDE